MPISVLAAILQRLFKNAVLLLCSLLSPGGRNCNHRQAYSHRRNLQEWLNNNSKNIGLIEEGHKQKLDRVGRKEWEKEGQQRETEIVTFKDGIGENPPRSYGYTLTGRRGFLQELYIWNEPSSPNFRGI